MRQRNYTIVLVFDIPTCSKIHKTTVYQFYIILTFEIIDIVLKFQNIFKDFKESNNKVSL